MREMDGRDSRILSMVAPTIPMWAVFGWNTSDGMEIDTQKIHLWAHVRYAISDDDKASDEFLGKESPEDRFQVEGMVWLGSELVLVSEHDADFLEYSETEELTPETMAEVKKQYVWSLKRRQEKQTAMK